MMDVEDDLVALLEGVIAESDEFDHLAMWLEALEDENDESDENDEGDESGDEGDSETQSVLAALAEDPAVQNAMQAAEGAAEGVAPPPGEATQAMVDFLQATLGIAAPLARTESPEGGKVQTRVEGLTSADARELFP